MERSIVINLIYNIAILLTLAIVSSAFQGKVKGSRVLNLVISGTFIGIAGLLIMSTAVKFSSGVIFDSRSILISVTGMFFGLIPTLIAAAIMTVYRIILGGSGMYMGVLVILTTAAIGVLWHSYRFPKILNSKKTYEFYLFGLIIHLDMLFCMLALPKDQIFNVLKYTSLPIIILYPIGTYLLCIFLLNRYAKNDLIEKLGLSEEKYRQLAENVSDVIWTADLNLNLTYVSPSIEKLVGEPSSVFINRTMQERFPQEDLDKINQLFHEGIKEQETLDKSESKIIETRHYRADGSLIWVSMNITFLRDKNGNLIGIQGVSRDITERKISEEETAKQAGLILSLIDSIPDLIFYKDINGVYLGCNIPFSEFVGQERDDIIGKTDYELFQEEVAEFFRLQDKEMLKVKQERRNEEWVSYPDGRRVLLDTLKTPYWGADGTMIGILGVSRDITERKKKEDEITYIGYHDLLTGLYNRRFYEEEIHRLDVKRNLPLTIVMGDVDGLKLINDSFGHEAGDNLLKKAAEIIKKSCRTDDIIARFGGDEFIMILPKTDSATASEIIRRINEQLIHEKINGLDISISFGYDTKANETEDIHVILKDTEDRMYRYKLYVNTSLRSKTIDMIMNTLFEKNKREMMHSKRVSQLCEELAIKMNLDHELVNKYRMAGLVHDIGKIGIDENILNSSEKLTAEQWNEIKKHPEIGYRILSSASEYTEVAGFVLEHQEKWDGSGYPKGLKGENISLGARIIAIADAYDAMTSKRTYSEMKSHQEALEEIERGSGSQFDPEIVKVFINGQQA